MMSTYLNVALVGFKIASAIVIVAGAIDGGDAITCLLRGSVGVAPVAWAIANRIFPGP